MASIGNADGAIDGDGGSMRSEVQCSKNGGAGETRKKGAKTDGLRNALWRARCHRKDDIQIAPVGFEKCPSARAAPPEE
jgi:hypothetical protein